MADPTLQHADATPDRPKEYVVVARRYRPQVFEDLIGQEHVARALSNAITTNRVGHAYLFTGARGVGKTSAARIFAKALNCETGPTPVPCNRCEICQSITSGDDVDILEIDGASNRGIDEIRQLRQNVNVRPSRARLKIYIIDEVHMLTREAFNALLKTLEEPPEHVKFIFCTTDPNKLPITILSRCQRYDFAGIQTVSIAQRLAQIVAAEGVEAEADALEVLARRAAGSMRDGQSLLEQLLSFAPGRITLADVHGMLGTAGDQRLAELVDHLVARNAAGALADLDGAMGQGVDVGLLLEQLFGYLRDCLTAAVGCPPDTFLYASPSTRDQVIASGKALGLHTILAAMQILDQTLARLRQSTQSRVLAELAIVRICMLEELDELASLAAQLKTGTLGGLSGATAGSSSSTDPGAGRLPRPPVGSSPGQKKTSDPQSVAPSRSEGAMGGSSALEEAGAVKPPQTHSTQTTQPPVGERIPLTAENATEIWGQVMSRLSGMLAENAAQAERVAISAPNRLVVAFKSDYTFAKAMCERADNLTRFQQALAELTGQPVGITFTLIEGEPDTQRPAQARSVSPQQRLMEVADHPLVRRAKELFGAEPTRVTDPPKP